MFLLIVIWQISKGMNVKILPVLNFFCRFITSSASPASDVEDPSTPLQLRSDQVRFLSYTPTINALIDQEIYCKVCLKVVSAPERPQVTPHITLL